MNARSGSGSRMRRALRLTGCNVLTAAVLLVPVELGLRLFDFEFALAPPQVFGWPDSAAMNELGLVVEPDLLWVDPGYRARVAAAQHRSPAIVLMGDSCTLPEPEQYGRNLRSMVRARNPGAAADVASLGVVGWSSWSGLQQLRRDVLPMRPKAVTINYGWNDHWRNLGLPDKDAARFLGEPSRLRTAQLVDKALFAFARLHADPGPYRVSLADFRANLRRMVRLARDNGIVPILLTAPTSHRPGREPEYLAPRWVADLADLVPLHGRYAQAVRDVAAAEDAPLVDLHREFDRLPRQDLDRLLREDGIHLSPAGNQKIAELIDRHFVEADLYRRIFGRAHAERIDDEEWFRETLADGRLLMRGRWDVWLADGRLIYVKDRCDDDFDERFFLHVRPADPDDLPEDRKEHGFDNLDFGYWSTRLNLLQKCAAVRLLPDYPVAAIRTGQFQYGGENGFTQLWGEEIDFPEDPAPTRRAR